jgi:predicted signal transduction protein with EAL and GGDEF domain
VGYAEFPFISKLPLALTLDQTIEITDQALYHAKDNGRNKAVFAEYNYEKHKKISLEDAKTMMKNISKSIEINHILLKELQ